MCRVLDEIAGQIGSHVLVANDRVADIERAASELPGLTLQGFEGKRTTFTSRFLRLALSRNFDLALLGHINYAPLGPVLKRMQPRIRYGVMLYGIEAWRQLPLLKRHALQRADFLISISGYTKRKAAEVNGLDLKKIDLLPNALEWSEYQRPTTHETGSGARLLSVCRLDRNEQYKGVDKVIEVLPEVAKKVPDIQYVVVGGGTDLERHRQLAQQLGVAKRVHFLGFISDEALRECYRDCDLFVMPSAGEGFGFVFLEAMQYGKAIVAANSAGAPEVVPDGVTGSLVEYGNKEQLTQTLIGLCLDPARRQMLGQGSYQRLQENFTYAHFKQRLTEILMRELPPEEAYRIDRSEETRSCAS